MKALAALFVAALVLLSVELGMGAWGFGAEKRTNPCAARPSFPGHGLDATLQRLLLDGLDGAACELHTTREELVLSLRPSAGHRIRWDRGTIERAVRAGLLRAIDRAEARGDIPGIVADVLRAAARHAPVALLVEGGGRLADLLSRLPL